MNILDFVYYDDTSPSGLRWKECKYHKFSDVVGSIEYRKDGSVLTWRTRFIYKRYKVHRIIYELFHGKIDSGLVIDHVDGNPLNNTITNLREVTSKVNSRNMKMHSRNKTGKTGVCRVRGKTSDYYRATILCDLTGKLISKNFNITRLGNEEAFRLACECRDKMEESSVDYSSRHGSALSLDQILSVTS